MSNSFGSLALVKPILEILASAEGSALTSEDDDPERRLGLEPFEDTANVFFHGICHGIELLGPVEGHLEHMACWSSKDEMRAHLGHHQLWCGHAELSERQGRTGWELGEASFVLFSRDGLCTFWYKVGCFELIDFGADVVEEARALISPFEAWLSP